VTYLVTFGFPILWVMFFHLLPFRHGILAVILSGMLLLPSLFSIGLPLLPDLNRDNVTVLTALLCALIYHGAYVKEQSAQGAPPVVLGGWMPKDPIVLLLLAILVFGPIGTVVTNGESVNVGWLPEHSRPGLGVKDILNMFQTALLTLLPLFVARRYLCTPESHRIVLVAIVVAALIYSLPALAEIRLSPIFHTTVYGYFPSQYMQHYRAGGFRPIVFMPHGLVLGMFLSLSVIAALALWKSEPKDRAPRFLLFAVWLGGTLFLSKNVGALMIAMVLAPAVILLSPRRQVLFAACVALVVVAYPALRGIGISPLQYVADYLQSGAPGRANSLQYRLDNEQLMLDKTLLKPLFGWGGWGRNMIMAQESRAVPLDGAWIIYISQRGWIGFLGLFGIFAYSVISLLRPGILRALHPATAGLSLVLVANFVDLIPNAGMTPLTWLIVGALVGHIEYARARTPAAQAAVAPGRAPSGRAATPPLGVAARFAGASPASVAKGDGRTRYTRFGGQDRTRQS